MARRFLPVNRDQPVLLPVNMYDWVPRSHFVWFVIDTVAELDTSVVMGAKGTSRGGRPGFHPVMLLTLLIWAYACGLRSSRAIEARCRIDATFRLVCADQIPDHTTIARFRRAFGLTGGAIESLFAQVLAVCANAGLGRLDYVSADGTKIKANASKDANRTEDGCRKLAEKILAEAEAADTPGQDPIVGLDLGAGVELSGQLADPASRPARIRACLADLQGGREAKQAERRRQAEEYLQSYRDGRPMRGGHHGVPLEVQIEAAQIALERARAIEAERDADYARRLAEVRAKAGKGLPGHHKPAEERRSIRVQRERLARLLAKQHAEPGPDEPDGNPDGTQDTEPAKQVRNITDPQSRLMHSRQGKVQAYNVQVAASADRLVLDCYATNAGVDAEQAVPLMQAAEAAAAILIGVHTGPGHDPIGCHQTMCPHTRNDDDDHPCDPIGCHAAITHQLALMLFDAGYCSEANISAPGPDRLIATGKTSTLQQKGPASGDPPDDATATEKMDHRLRTPQGRAAYKHRAPDVEGVNASFKDRIGLRQFALRGLKLADFEAKLTGMIHNLALAHHRTALA